MSQLIDENRKFNRAPRQKEISRMEKSPPALKKQMTDEQLAKFLQQQEELLSFDGSSFSPSMYQIPTDENLIPQNHPSNTKELSKDEQLAWKLQMEEQYYEDLLNQRENPSEFEFSDNEESEDGLLDDTEISHEDDGNNRITPQPISFDEGDSYEDEESFEEDSNVFETYEELLQLDEIAPPVSKGAKSDVIDKIKEFKITKEQLETYDKCNVCLEEFEEKDECRLLPCQHAYHKPCIDHWLSINKICPVCRTEIEQ